MQSPVDTNFILYWVVVPITYRVIVFHNIQLACFSLILLNCLRRNQFGLLRKMFTSQYYYDISIINKSEGGGNLISIKQMFIHSKAASINAIKVQLLMIKSVLKKFGENLYLLNLLIINLIFLINL